jgi:opacity protein-like surface antigen
MIMKTIRLITIVLFTFLFFNLNAQVFVGGNLGFNASGGSQDDGIIKTDKNTSTYFSFSPKIGKFLSEKVAAGVMLNFAYGKTTIPGNSVTINTGLEVGITPFLRYYAVRIDKFSVFGQANVGISSHGTKNKVDNVSTDGPNTTNFFFSLVPGLSYDISDKLSLETNINLLNLSFNESIVKFGTTKDVNTTFSAGAGLNNIVTLGSVSIGAIYKF